MDGRDELERPERGRPELTSRLSVEEFQRWRWRKDQLQAFCRTSGMVCGGSKGEIIQRIEAFLLQGASPSYPTKRPRRKQARSIPNRAGEMPARFSDQTRIGPGWRCTASLRSYFVERLGKSFRFNEPLRRFLREGVGRSLAEAVEVYRDAIRGPRLPIGRQFEYNQHVRRYYQEHPGSTHAQMVAAWQVLKQQPRGADHQDTDKQDR
jgi:hypothetical protein